MILCGMNAGSLTGSAEVQQGVGFVMGHARTKGGSQVSCSPRKDYHQPCARGG